MNLEATGSSLWNGKTTLCVPLPSKSPGGEPLPVTARQSSTLTLQSRELTDLRLTECNQLPRCQRSLTFDHTTRISIQISVCAQYCLLSLTASIQGRHDSPSRHS